MRMPLALAMIAGMAALGQDVVFRTETRLVEVYATIQDQHGRYLDGLTRDRFQVRDNGQLQRLTAFESNAEHLACAILLDTTGSMTGALPALKNSVNRMIDDLPDGDSVAVYSFNTSLNRLQDFTTDKASAQQAVLRIRAAGETALFDSISELAREIEPRPGKKAIVVFTDGADNASVLNVQAAVQRAKKAGVPVYAVAEGEALKTKELLARLKDIAEMTGAQLHLAHKTADINKIFLDISGDLQHTYMLSYQPPISPDPKWRTIELTVTGLKGAKIRAKQGYLPE